MCGGDREPEILLPIIEQAVIGPAVLELTICSRGGLLLATVWHHEQFISFPLQILVL